MPELREADATFFDSPAAFYDWLAENHETEDEVFVGYFKKATGKQTVTWSQSVDQALCFGWIDSVMRSIDDERHMQRFTPHDYFEGRAPSYRRTAIHWVASAKREETRVRRIGQLIECSAKGEDLPQFRWSRK